VPFQDEADENGKICGSDVTEVHCGDSIFVKLIYEMLHRNPYKFVRLKVYIGRDCYETMHYA